MCRKERKGEIKGEKKLSLQSKIFGCDQLAVNKNLGNALIVGMSLGHLEKESLMSYGKVD